MLDKQVVIAGGGIGDLALALPNQIMGAKTPTNWYEALDWRYGGGKVAARKAVAAVA
jgi:hypothetical protein